MSPVVLAQKYVGTTWVKDGRTWEEGFDCFGLYRDFVGQFLNKDIPIFLIPVGTNKERADAIFNNIASVVRPLEDTEKPVPGDGCILSYMGESCHIAVYIGSNMLLHTTECTNGIISSLDEMDHGRTLRSRIRGWYRCL